MKQASAALALLLLAPCAQAASVAPPARVFAAAAVSLAYLGFCALVTWSWRRRARPGERLLGGAGAPILIGYASQTGHAESIALRSAEALHGAGRRVELLALKDIGAEVLARHREALFVASTTGEGDAPDNAARFVRDHMGSASGLAHLQYGVLALGDSRYANFCGFGHALARWLRHAGAAPLFDTVEVDDADPGALRHWQHQLATLGGHVEMADWRAPDYGRWTLAERRLLNPGSQGGPAFHIALRPCEAMPDWVAGDIAEIGPAHPPEAVAACLARLGFAADAEVQDGGQARPLAQALARRHLPALDAPSPTSPQALVDAAPLLPHREYSIASLPADGQLELLVRQMHGADGGLGLGSGWLTAHAAPGTEIALRIRRNRSFHAPEEDRPLILIGSGTGLAGLRAHIKARAAAGRHRNWLVFGERQEAHDAFHAEEIAAWLASGVLTRVDRVFSRDAGSHRYVQDRLRADAAELREWVAAGAAIYVCGNLEGMAAGVHAALGEVLGATGLEALADAGRYRRDVY